MFNIKALFLVTLLYRDCRAIYLRAFCCCICIVCDRRNAQKRSSATFQPAEGVYETSNPTGQDDQPQYDVIQLGHTQHGPDAGHYDSLNPQTQGEQPQYDVIKKDKDAPDYANMM